MVNRRRQTISDTFAHNGTHPAPLRVNPSTSGIPPEWD